MGHMPFCVIIIDNEGSHGIWDTYQKCGHNYPALKNRSYELAKYFDANFFNCNILTFAFKGFLKNSFHMLMLLNQNPNLIFSVCYFKKRTLTENWIEAKVNVNAQSLKTRYPC